MEEYFSKFPIIAYDFSSEKEKITYILRDITRNVRLRKEVLKEISLYDYYDIKDGETPEMISQKVYNTPYYHWIIMLANETYNWIEDYPLTDAELEKYIEEKYGSVAQAMEEVHHYLNEFGQVVFYKSGMNHLNYAPTDAFLTKVSCYDYEVRVNESKRRIKIINPSLVSRIIASFRDIM